MRDRESVDTNGAAPSSEIRVPVQFSGLILDLDACTLARESGETIPLTRGEFALLRFLVNHPRRVLSRDTLLDAIAGRRLEPFDRSVDVMVGRLRRKIEPDPKAPCLIVTVAGGYQFAAPLRKARPIAAPELEEAALSAATPGALASLSAPAVARAHLPGTAAAHLTSAEHSPRPSSISSAERRQVTILICELVGTAALSSRLDPEDLREIIAAYHLAIGEVVTGFQGFVGKYMGEYAGEGVLVYFGYPQAHEDDAERAVRAGLSAIDVVGRLDVKSVKLQARVGIATGLVVAGDIMGAGSAHGQSVVGETPHLAGRLKDLAEPEAVVIAASTRRLVGDLFEYRSLSAVEGKGVAAPSAVWQVLRPSIVASRFEALRGSALTPLVGRDEEVDLLLRRWARAKAGDGQIVLISGEPGIGKSRIAAELQERLRTDSHLRMRYFCSPFYRDSALFPFIDRLVRVSGFERKDTPAVKLEKLEAVLARAAPPDEDVALLADLMSLPASDRYPLPDLNPQQKKDRTLEALIRLLERLARQRPVLMVLEDAHWIDPTSRDLLDLAVERIRSLPVLLVATFRPEFHPPWTGQPQVTMLALNRLDRRDRIALATQIADGKALPDEVVAEIVDRTDGVPLFIEELTRSVLESGLLREETDRYVLERPLPPLAIPATLHDSLMARLDRLGSVRHVAQIGAAIGREFSYSLLRAVSRLSEDELRTSLTRLVGSELVFQRGAPPDAVYLFKHALVQDAAYCTLLREARRALHARIAEVLENQFADIGEAQPERLARHFTEAGLIEKAAALWGKAGELSLARSALIEATEQLTQALAQIAALPATPALRHEEIKLQVAFISALIHVRGFAAPETKAAEERARLLIEQAEARGEPPNDPLLLFSVLYGIWVANGVAFDGDKLRELAAHFLTLAEKQRATIPLLIGHRLTGFSLLFTGEIALGRTHFDRAIALYDPAERHRLATRFGGDSRAVVLCYRALASWMLGYPDAALADTGQAIKYAREIGHAATLMYTLGNGSLTNVVCGDYVTATAYTDELVVLADEKNAPFWKSQGVLIGGSALALTGKASDAVEMITSGITALRSTGATIQLPVWLSYLAKAYAELRQFVDASCCLGEAMAAVQTTKETSWEADIHRIAGEIALLSPERDAAKAQAYFERALKVARAQQARSWELRAAMSLARLWRDQGRRADASDLLAPVYGWFTEGLDTRDLREAKTLMAELS
jgi:class 3 adenylate cyclase/predicted ATPase